MRCLVLVTSVLISVVHYVPVHKYRESMSSVEPNAEIVEKLSVYLHARVLLVIQCYREQLG